MRKIKRDEAVQWNGLTLYPILVDNYEYFQIAKTGIMVSQQTLPGKYISMKYLEALYALDYDVKETEGLDGGFFARTLLFLSLSLRMEMKKNENGQDVLPIGMKVERDNPRKLISLQINQNGTNVEVTPQAFNQLREIIAVQNGVEMPDECENPDLVKTEKQIAAKNSMNLIINQEDLIYSMAVKTGIDVQDIYKWTVRKFLLMERATDRTTGHLIAALTEASGGKYKNGNPYPSWKYDRDMESSALVSMEGFIQRMSGSVAMK